MGTVVAIASERGVAIAGDTRSVDGGTVTSGRLGRVFDFGSAGAGAVGEAGDLQAFGRRVESELRTWRLEHGDEVDVDRLARIAARVASETTVDAAVGARDSEGVPGLREVGADGRVLESSEVALGSGAQTALGRLESEDAGRDAEDPAATAREVLAVVMERDAATGDGVDVWSLSGDAEAPGDDR